MPDHIELIFTDYQLMLRKLKKPSYIANMERFRREQGHLIDEMLAAVRNADDEAEAIARIGASFAARTDEAFFAGRKRNGRKMADLHFFMIYYVFPAILLTEEECAQRFCDGLKDAWNAGFGSNISYTTYENLCDTFRNKIFGIF